jgi:hypothetical protein
MPNYANHRHEGVSQIMVGVHHYHETIHQPAAGVGITPAGHLASGLAVGKVASLGSGHAPEPAGGPVGGERLGA